MFRTLVPVACLALAAATGCRSNFSITESPTTSLAPYTMIHVAPIGRDGDWANDPKHGPYTEKWVKIMQERVVAWINKSDLFGNASEGEGGSADTLVVRATVTEYNPGNRALRWLGAGGQGKVLTEITLNDGASGEQLAAGTAWAQVGGGAYGGDFDECWNVCGDGIFRFLTACRQQSEGR